jgi:N-acyl-D-aspartate/D-glutamate deacylase
MPMEKCIWRLTKEQADWFELDCGHLKEGAVADLVVLDPAFFDNITEEVEDAEIEEFDGYRRLVNRHPGVVSKVIVGGEVVYEEEEFVASYARDRRYGRFLRYGERVAPATVASAKPAEA